MKRVLDSVADGVVVADASGRLTFFNPAAEEILGRGLMDVPASEWAARYGCCAADGVTPVPARELPLARALRGETVKGAELLVRTAKAPAGAWLSINATPLTDRRGRIHGGGVVFRDVTTHERELRRIELLSNVVEQTADGVLVTDAKGSIEYVNPAFERITGYGGGELIGRRPAVLSSGVHPADFYAGLWRRLAAGEVFRGTITDRRKDGETFLAEQTITPMRGAAGEIEHLVSIVKDVTGARRAEQREMALQLARRVQQRLYPESAPRIPGIDIHGQAFVADATGGDYYDFLPLAGERLGIVIGDVSGHGLDSALVMAALRAVLRAAAQTHSDPGEILSAVNRVLVADTDDGRFATLLLAALHVPSRTLRYASAGHPPACLLDATGNVRERLAATSPPLGLFPDAAFPCREGVSLGPGESLVLYTDGAIDAESPGGEPFGTERLVDVVRSRRGARSSTVVDAILAAVREFRGAALPQDDVTVVLCAMGA